MPIAGPGIRTGARALQRLSRRQSSSSKLGGVGTRKPRGSVALERVEANRLGGSRQWGGVPARTGSLYSGPGPTAPRSSMTIPRSLKGGVTGDPTWPPVPRNRHRGRQGDSGDCAPLPHLWINSGPADPRPLDPPAPVGPAPRLQSATASAPILEHSRWRARGFGSRPRGRMGLISAPSPLTGPSSLCRDSGILPASEMDAGVLLALASGTARDSKVLPARPSLCFHWRVE